MRFNPYKGQRHRIRKHGYDYSQSGAYFITICTLHRTPIFGTVIQGKMILNDSGLIAHRVWENLPDRWGHIQLGAFQIMPNHMHGILIFQPPEPDDTVDPNQLDEKIQWARRPTVGQVVSAYKSIVYNEYYKLPFWDGQYGPQIWQRNYWEHIIRDQDSYQRIHQYILNNPASWEKDRFRP